MSKDQIYTIADFNSVKKRVDDLKNRSDDIKSRLAATLKKLWNTERLLRAVPESTDFSLLRQRFPHFEEVIDFYQNTVISLARLNLPFEIPPILLQGDPGLGKTYFVCELAKLINIPFSEISLATVTSSFLLSGGGLQWSEGSVGLISETLVSSPIANPMILIDEIDKASGDSRYNPMNVFYSLLEPHSAKRFRDEALEIELDASKLIWIATGNYIRNIPAPIQSRMRVFHIEQPAPEKMLTVIESIYDYIIRNKVYGQLLDSVLDEEVLTKLANQSPRAVRLAIEEAAFKAIRNQRSVITTSDLPITKKEKYRVGFI